MCAVFSCFCLQDDKRTSNNPGASDQVRPCSLISPKRPRAPIKAVHPVLCTSLSDTVSVHSQDMKRPIRRVRTPPRPTARLPRSFNPKFAGKL